VPGVIFASYLRKEGGVVKRRHRLLQGAQSSLLLRSDSDLRITISRSSAL
jgi:hypothetical protein